MKLKLTKKNALDFFLIMAVFALTGSSSVFVSGFIAKLLGVQPWSIGYIAAFLFFIIPVYHTLILVYAYPLGQFNFFFNRYKWMFDKLKSAVKPDKPASEEN